MRPRRWVQITCLVVCCVDAGAAARGGAVGSLAVPVRQRVSDTSTPPTAGATLTLAADAVADARAAERAGRSHALFLLRLGSFTEWPATAAADEEPFVIGLLGHEPWRATLERVAKEEFVHGRPVQIVQAETVPGVIPCAILFICASHAAHLDTILAQIAGEPILTVSDLPAFTAAGGMIGLHAHDGGLSLEVNLEAVRAAGLALSSKLLRMADTKTLEEGAP